MQNDSASSKDQCSGSGTDQSRVNQSCCSEDSEISYSNFPGDEQGTPGVVAELSSNRIRELAPCGERSGEADFFQRVRESFFGKIYIRYFKRYPIVRGVVIKTWINIFPLLSKYVFAPAVFFRNRFDPEMSRQLRWRELIKQSDYVKQFKSNVLKIADVSVVDTPIPSVFPVEERACLQSPHDRYEFPEITVFEVPQATVYGRTNLLLVDDLVICHDLYDFSRDYTSEELHGRTIVDLKRGRVRWLQYDNAPASLASAAIFTDATAPNYAHWLTEVLPRIAMFCDVQIYAHVPLVVDAGLHPNLMESLRLIAGEQREIICIPVGRAVNVERLYVTSSCGYVPFGRRATKMSGHSHGAFSPIALEKVRAKLFGCIKNGSYSGLPKKIYIRRTSGTRKVSNIESIETILKSSGFSVVEPEKLGFIEQVKLFSHAEVIVGSSGAALANLVFSAPGTKIVILIASYPDTSYWYWQNIACATFNEIRYVLGHINKGDQLGIHADFTVSPDDVRNIIRDGIPDGL